MPPIGRWGIDADLTPLSGGFRNLVFRTVGLGPGLVFKSCRRSTEAVEWLLPVHDAARRSGFVVPRFSRSLNGLLVEAGWTCETFVAGTSCTRADLLSIAAQVSRFHELTTDFPQRPGLRWSQDLLELEAGGDVDLTAMPPGLVAVCRRAWREVSAGPASVVHGDLNTGNMLRCAEGRVALLDWDECRRDLAIFDLGQLVWPGPAGLRALLAWEAACSWRPEPEHARKTAARLLRMHPPAREQPRRPDACGGRDPTKR